MEGNGQHGAATGPGGTSAPLSLAALSKRCMDNPQVTLMVLDRFERQLQTDIVAMESRMTSSDTQGVARIAHALKGAAGAAGAERVQSAAAELESVAKRAELGAIGAQLRVLREHVEACLTFIPSARRAMGGGAGHQVQPPESM